MLADASGDGGFGLSLLAWHGPAAGQNAYRMLATAGNFGRDRRTDVSSFLNYKDANGNDGTRDTIHTLTAGPRGHGYFAGNTA